MKRVHPLPRLLLLGATYLTLFIVVGVYVIPLDRERRVVHADMLAQSPAGADISGLVLPLVELQQAHAERGARLQDQITELSATPTTDEVLGKVGASLSERSLSLARFAPLTTGGPITTPALLQHNHRLVLDRFELEFRASLEQIIGLSAELTSLSLGLSVERLDITATSESERLQVLMTCALIRRLNSSPEEADQ